MGGLYNRKISGRSSTNRATARLKIPTGADAGLRYMKLHNLLSRNPLGSGGVGRMFNIRPRGSGLGNVKPTTDNVGDSLGDEDNLGNSEIDSDWGFCDTKVGGGCGDGQPCCFYQCQNDTDCPKDRGFLCYGTNDHPADTLVKYCKTIIDNSLNPGEECASTFDGAYQLYQREGQCKSGFCPSTPPSGQARQVSYCPDTTTCFCGKDYADIQERCGNTTYDPVKRCPKCGRGNECGQDMSCITVDFTCSNAEKTCTIGDCSGVDGSNGCIMSTTDGSFCCTDGESYDGSGCNDFNKLCGLNTKTTHICETPVSPCTTTPPPSTTNYCGTSYGDASSRCHAQCPGGNDDECNTFPGEKCFATTSCTSS